jgi:hypothetical protein
MLSEVTSSMCKIASYLRQGSCILLLLLLLVHFVLLNTFKFFELSIERERGGGGRGGGWEVA